MRCRPVSAWFGIVPSFAGMCHTVFLVCDTLGLCEQLQPLRAERGQNDHARSTNAAALRLNLLVSTIDQSSVLGDHIITGKTLHDVAEN